MRSVSFRGPVELSLANLALPLSALLISPVLARALGPTARGTLAAYLSISLLSPALFGSGLQDALTSLGSRRPAPIGLWSAATTYAARIAVLAALATALVSYFVVAHALLLAAVCGVYTALMVLFMPVRAALLAAHRFGLVARERWVQVLVRTAAILAVFLVGRLSVSIALVIQLASIALGSATLLLRRPKMVADGTTDDRSAATRRIGSFTRRTALGSLGSVVVLRLDQVLMKPLSNSYQLGIYAVAVGVAEVPLAVSAALRNVVIPRVAHDNSRASLRAPILTISLGGAMMLAGVTLFGRRAISLVYGRNFEGAYWPMVILAAACIFAGVLDVLVAGLVGLGRPTAQSVCLVIASVVTVAALIALLPRWGAVGGAFATLAAYSSALGVAAVIVVRWRLPANAHGAASVGGFR